MSELWDAIALNNNWIKNKNLEVLTKTTRNSGEKTTSSTNTLLQYLLSTWVLQEKMKLP